MSFLKNFIIELINSSLNNNNQSWRKHRPLFSKAKVQRKHCSKSQLTFALLQFLDPFKTTAQTFPFDLCTTISSIITKV